MSVAGRAEPRPISRLLIANRGEIAARILASALELDIETYALYTAGDDSHTHGAHKAVQLPLPANYMDIAHLIDIVKQHSIDAVHPGYGFLSESAEFAERMWHEADCNVIGPGWQVLAQTGDKLAARSLAVQLGVPVLPALSTPTSDVAVVQRFADSVKLPIMVKAVDGGGGRGIRLIRRAEDLDSLVMRAVEESPSRQVFAEKAAVDGFMHVEIQIVGDGRDVIHLFDRQCSIQRRYQKVIEVAPWPAADRAFVDKIAAAAVAMARKVKYFSLGTFEFLANARTEEFHFLEINPRLQVEHTVTESICAIDLVRSQLLLAQGAELERVGLATGGSNHILPALHSLQLRITAEDVERDWSLSVGKLTAFNLPRGNGIRVDAAIEAGQTVGTDFDSLLAKIIVTARDWTAVVAKARRALEKTQIEGVKTNLVMLRGVLEHPEFMANAYDAQWLERNSATVLKLGQAMTERARSAIRPTQSSTSTIAASTATALRKGDAWKVEMTPITDRSSGSQPSLSHLQLTKIYRNDFPNALSAELTITSTSSAQSYKIDVSSTSMSGPATTAQHRRGDTSNPLHVVLPFSGRLVEVCVDEGDMVKTDDVICVVQQMKMEVEVRARRAGRVVWVTDIQDGEEVVEGVLAAELADGPKL